MKSSIRKFLLINLLLAISITTSLTAIGNYYLDQKDIQKHLDSLMAISALSYQALLGDDIYKRPINEIQEKLSSINNKAYSNLTSDVFLDNNSDISHKFNFQVWSNEGKLLLHSAATPKVPLFEEDDGFSDRIINNKKWRIFTAYNDKAGVRTVLAERYGTRNELGHRIAWDDLYIMLLTFPLSGFLIWIIIGRGLDSLDKVAEEVSNRESYRLEPVNISEVPQEIMPVIDELNKLFSRLKEGFEREKRFAADAAHELRTPLAAIKTQTQIAINSSKLEDKDKALKKLLLVIDRTAHIVEQLLTMNHIFPEAVLAQNLEVINLASLCREIIAMLAPKALNKNIDISFEATDKIPNFRGNQASLNILVRNLVDNAIRYSNKDGIVSIRLGINANRVVFEVEDNGPGIAEELHSRVFERFFRVLGNNAQGSGLGLAIVKQICTLHDGKIKLLKPKGGKGLLVEVSFPIKPGV